MKECMETILYQINDPNPNILKKVITSSTISYRRAFQLMYDLHTLSNHHRCTDSNATQHELTQLWGIMTQLRRKIIESLDNENDGVKVHAYHFLETLIVIYSFPASSGALYVGTRKGPKLTSEQEDVRYVNLNLSINNPFSLILVPANHPVLNVGVLKKEGEQYLGLLLSRAAGKLEM